MLLWDACQKSGLISSFETNEKQLVTFPSLFLCPMCSATHEFCPLSTTCRVHTSASAHSSSGATSPSTCLTRTTTWTWQREFAVSELGRRVNFLQHESCNDLVLMSQLVLAIALSIHAHAHTCMFTHTHACKCTLIPAALPTPMLWTC